MSTRPANRLQRPQVWLPLGLLILTAFGGYFLTQPSCVQLSERDSTAYGLRPMWQAHFDALSAACGAGLLTYDLREDYTPLGRWALIAIGLAGAALYIAAACRVVARFWSTEEKSLPPVRIILASFLAVQVVVIPLFWLALRATGTQTGFLDAAWQALALFSSLGWLHPQLEANAGWLFAAVAFCGALGWSTWIWLRVGLARRFVGVRPWLIGVGGYAAFLLLAAILVAALDSPRGLPRGVSDQLCGPRYARSLVRVTCASGAGTPIEQPRAADSSEGSKLILAGVILAGGLGGSAGGGLKLALLVAALSGGLTLLRRGTLPSGDDPGRRCFLASLACLGTLMSLVIVVALGLMLIEAHVASRFHSPPTVADAFLDASSAVGGANLSSGLTATITSANLSRGIRQSVDAYQYGMTWLMLAMFIGRIAPVLVLSRFAQTAPTDHQPSRPPLL